ncbi:MAG: hypothetical protein JWN43_4625 [Gammaproteobacteria bacterium]|nr:hypothetical protein [Gammaproteobacteria bacterium]
MTDVLSVMVRALSFVLLFQAAGAAMFAAGFGDRLANSRLTVRRLGEASAAAAIVAVVGHHALEAARMAGEFSGMWDPTLQAMAWNSPARAALLCRLAGLLLIALGLRTVSPRSTRVAVAGAALAVGSFTLTGHTSVHVHRGVLAALLMLHLLIVAFWFGALGPLYVASLRETAARASDIIGRFTAVAMWLVPVILLAGMAMAFLLLPDASALREPYGELLIAKAAGFVLLMGLAAANKWRLGPALVHAPVQVGRWFRRSVAAEFVLITVVFMITAAMTSLFSPGP